MIGIFRNRACTAGWWAIAVLAIMAGGCSYDVRIDSMPQGADVYINGVHFGKTPITAVSQDASPIYEKGTEEGKKILALNQSFAGRDYKIEIKKPGYKTYIGKIPNTFKLGRFLASTLYFGPLGWLMFGVLSGFAGPEKHFSVELEPIPGYKPPPSGPKGAAKPLPVDGDKAPAPAGLPVAVGQADAVVTGYSGGPSGPVLVGRAVGGRSRPCGGAVQIDVEVGRAEAALVEVGLAEGTPAAAVAPAPVSRPAAPARTAASGSLLSAAIDGPEIAPEPGAPAPAAPRRPIMRPRKPAKAGTARYQICLNLRRQVIDVTHADSVQHYFFSLRGDVAQKLDSGLELAGFLELAHLLTYVRNGANTATSDFPSFGLRLGGMAWVPKKWFAIDLDPGMLQFGGGLEFQLGYALGDDTFIFGKVDDSDYMFVDLRLNLLGRIVKGKGMLAYMEPYFGVAVDVFYQGQMSAFDRTFSKYTFPMVVVAGVKMFVGEHLNANFEVDFWTDEFTVASSIGYDF